MVRRCGTAMLRHDCEPTGHVPSAINYQRFVRPWQRCQGGGGTVRAGRAGAFPPRGRRRRTAAGLARPSARGRSALLPACDTSLVGLTPFLYLALRGRPGFWPMSCPCHSPRPCAPCEGEFVPDEGLPHRSLHPYYNSEGLHHRSQGLL